MAQEKTMRERSEAMFQVLKAKLTVDELSELWEILDGDPELHLSDFIFESLPEEDRDERLFDMLEKEARTDYYEPCNRDPNGDDDTAMDRYISE